MTPIKRIDRIGQEYGLWTVISFDRRQVKGRRGINYWVCRCRCGTTRSVCYSHLRKGNSKSCGCEHPGARTHGLRHTRSYQSWRGMMTRCYNENQDCYPNYGGRGIRVCKRWHKFENFFEDMGERPEDMTIDRKDNNGHYIKSNCRWATKQTQSRNQRRHQGKFIKPEGDED